MRRLAISCAFALPLLAFTAGPALADVKTREKSHLKLEGVLGRMFNLFGGKAAREGIVSTTAVKGNRKATMSETSGQIIDLSEEKIYEIDVKKKTYEVTTFEELRRRMREAREKAEKEAPKEQEPQEKSGEPAKELELDYDVKETGQKKQLAGYDAREVITTITVREKGKTLEEGGGIVMTANSWMGPEIPALKEVAEFDRRYWQQLQGPEAVGMSPEQMAMVLAMFPGVKQAMERAQREGVKMQGTPLASAVTFESVKSKAQMAQTTETSNSGGGLGGMLARKIAKKEDPKPRATIFTTQHEVQEVQTSVAAGDIDLPAGFKEKK
jgi:hypothetical protein